MSVIKLSIVIDAIDCYPAELDAFVELATGDIFLLHDELVTVLENGGGDYPDWMEEDMKLAKVQKANPDKFLLLPNQEYFHGYAVMADFVKTLKDESVVNRLNEALGMKKPFRRFKDAVYFLGLKDEWFAFRGKQVREAAIHWCEENEIEFEEG